MKCLWQIKVSYYPADQLGVTEILCSFRLVLDGKTGKGILELLRLEFLEKFSASNVALSDAECNTFRLLNIKGIADLSLLRTSFTKSLESEVSGK